MTHELSNLRADLEKKRTANKKQHTINGNAVEKIKILQINSGNGSFLGCKDRIKITVKELKPDVLIISEANVDINDVGNKLKIEDEWSLLFLANRAGNCTF